MNVSSEILKIFYIAVITIAIFVLSIKYFSNTYIKAEFNKLDPLSSNMDVYYKGYKLGKTTKVRISKDFKKTYLYITLNQTRLHLPKNITVETKGFGKDNKYVDIIYPKNPDKNYIHSGDTIKGVNLHKHTRGAQSVETLISQGEDFLDSAQVTTETFTELLTNINNIILENKDNIHKSTTSLKNSMQNLERLTQNLNKGITEKTINANSNNIKETTENLSLSTKNLITITNSLQKILCDIKQITNGLKEALSKHFGGARVIFGKPLS